MQNKPNFPLFSPENEDFTKKQTQFKPNSNPIKANFGPKTRVANQNKPNSNPISNREYYKTDKMGEMENFAFKLF